MTASLLIALIGLTDLVRATPSRGRRWAAIAVAWTAFAVLATVGLSVGPLPVVLLLAVAVAWVTLVPSVDTDRPRRLWPAFALVAAVLGATQFDDPVGAGPLVVALSEARGILGSASFPVVVAVAGIALFLVRSSNLITRAALGRAAAEPSSPASDTRRAWRISVRGRMLGEVREEHDDSPPGALLHGGRLIGPLERMLLVILGVAGAYVLIAALVAAKGIVRFPEISADRLEGSKAEEFLIGSLTSWSIAASAALYLVAVIRL